MSHYAVTRPTRMGRVICFVAVALAFSWSQWLAVIASQRRWLAADISLSTLAIFGPLVAAVVSLVGSSDDRRQWFWSVLRWRIPPVVGVLAVLLPPLLGIGCVALATAVTPSAPRVQAPSVATVVAVFAGMFVTAGVGEELGWRGFLLPELRKSLGPLQGSLAVAIIWFLWHLPLFWVIGATQREIPAGSFAVGLLSYSLILTWLVEKSNGSVLPAMLFHSSANVSFFLAMAYAKNLPQYELLSRTYVGAFAVLGAIAAVLLIRRDRTAARRPGAMAG